MAFGTHSAGGLPETAAVGALIKLQARVPAAWPIEMERHGGGHDTLSFPPKDTKSIFQVGLLTCESSTVGRLPKDFSPQWPECRPILTYSSGGCSGFSPLSLFVRLAPKPEKRETILHYTNQLAVQCQVSKVD